MKNKRLLEKLIFVTFEALVSSAIEIMQSNTIIINDAFYHCIKPALIILLALFMDKANK